MELTVERNVARDRDQLDFDCRYYVMKIQLCLMDRSFQQSIFSSNARVIPAAVAVAPSLRRALRPVEPPVSTDENPPHPTVKMLRAAISVFAEPTRPGHLVEIGSPGIRDIVARHTRVPPAVEPPPLPSPPLPIPGNHRRQALPT